MILTSLYQDTEHFIITRTFYNDNYSPCTTSFTFIPSSHYLVFLSIIFVFFVYCISRIILEMRMSVTSSILKSGDSEYALIASDLREKAFKLPSLTVLLATEFWYVFFIKLRKFSSIPVFPMFHSLVHRSLQIAVQKCSLCWLCF